MLLAILMVAGVKILPVWRLSNHFLFLVFLSVLPVRKMSVRNPAITFWTCRGHSYDWQEKKKKSGFLPGLNAFVLDMQNILFHVIMNISPRNTCAYTCDQFAVLLQLGQKAPSKHFSMQKQEKDDWIALKLTFKHQLKSFLVFNTSFVSFLMLIL